MTYCVMPWVNISVDPDGSIKPCCISTDFIKKPDGSKFNLGNDTIEEIYNSEDFVKIRKKMLAGEKVAGCSQCYIQEKYGTRSHRLQYNQMYKNTFTNPVAETKIKYFDLRLGNMCNLNCKSCSPINSSQLSNEIKEINDPKILKYQQFLVEDINQWYKTKTFTENLDTQLENIDMIYLTGGEPTIIKQNFDLLEKLIKLNYSKNIIIKISSNLTNLNSNFVQLLSQFKTVIFFASIDGYGEIQEYIRYPSNWGQISKTFEKLLTIPNFIVKPTPVIQISNLNKIVDLFEYFENFNRVLNYPKVKIMPIMLENPSHLNMLYLPVEYKRMCLQRIDDWLKTCKFQDIAFFNSLTSLKIKCHLNVDPEDNLTKYLEYNKIFDQHRGHDLEKINPELFNIL